MQNIINCEDNNVGKEFENVKDSFLTNCYIRISKEQKGCMFYQDGDKVIARLDKYAIIPMEEYIALKKKAGIK